MLSRSQTGKHTWTCAQFDTTGPLCVHAGALAPCRRHRQERDREREQHAPRYDHGGRLSRALGSEIRGVRDHGGRLGHSIH